MKVTLSKSRIRHSLWVWAVGGPMVSAAVAAGQIGDYLGPCALVASKDAKTLYVANADAWQLVSVELPGGSLVRRVDLPDEPTGLVLSPDGTRLFVTCAAPKSTIVVIDTGSGKVVAKFPAGHTAMGPAIGPDAERLYVCNRFDNDVSIIELPGGKELA
ncbi:hypothetical protein LCGC14_3098160, partial [marine sediment metagenome]